MAQQREEARLASNNLAACREMAHEIVSLRDKHVAAPNEDAGIQELGKRIEHASQKAGLDGKAIKGIFPQTALPLADSTFSQKPTSLALQGVSLSKLASFLYYLTDGSELNVHALRLLSPRGGAADNLWDAEATVTYLICSPAGKARSD